MVGKRTTLIGDWFSNAFMFAKMFVISCAARKKILNGIYCPCAPVSTSANALLTGCKQRFDNQSRSCNQGCSQYNSTRLYIQYRPTNPLYCEFLWITLVQERTLKSGCTKINLYSLVFCLYIVQNDGKMADGVLCNKQSQIFFKTVVGFIYTFWYFLLYSRIVALVCSSFAND